MADRNDMAGEVTENILGYLMGGKCDFILSQDAVGGRPAAKRHYKLILSKGNNKCYYVYCEGGYIGYFMAYNVGNLKGISNKGNENELGKPLVVVLNSLKNNGKLPGNGVVHITSTGRCSVCGRVLTDRESIHYGVGPVCREKLKRFNMG